MKLLTKAIRNKLPPIGAQDGKGDDAIVYLKLFDPAGRYTLYVTEFDGDDLLYGYCISPLGPDCDEYGYSSLSELEGVKNRFGLGLERDMYFGERKLGEVKP